MITTLACILFLALGLSMRLSHTMRIQDIPPNDPNPVGADVTLTGNIGITDDFTINTGVSNQQQNIAFIKANLQLIIVLADQNLTLKTNSSGSPQETISLLANKSYLWFVGNGNGLANPFAGDVTTMYFSNASGTNANVKIRVVTS
jgi:hypothetical protein